MATDGESVGIDLGTTYSCVGVWQNDRVEIIANDQGNRTTPSYVAFNESERLIGDAAKNQVAMNASNTVFDAKRLIGRNFSDPAAQSDMKHWPFKCISGAGGKPMIEVEYKGETKQFAPEEISSMVLIKMREIAEEYIQSMGFPYHVVNIVSGELNNAAIKKYDIECWFPFQKKYRELVSCSNCTDYQSRAMEVRCGGKKMGSREKKYVHMLNSTLCACGRTICCLLENNQTDTGVVVPPVLRPFMGGVDFMPFIRTMDGKPFKAPVAPSNPEAAACAQQGDKIRQMKAAKASKEDIMAAVEELKKLKAKHLDVHGVEFAPTGTVQGLSLIHI